MHLWQRRSDRPHQRLVIGLVADGLTTHCLGRECRLVILTPDNFPRLLATQSIDLLFVESCWQGHRNAWKYQVAAYPDHPERSNRNLRSLLACARQHGIPAVFWNKEDGVHFDRFIDSARLFDRVLTVDQHCVPRYQRHLPAHARVATLPFPIQTDTHCFRGFRFRYRCANFIGSYSTHIHSDRRTWQHMAFGACLGAGLGLTVFDRNSDRKSPRYRFPPELVSQARPAIPHRRTARVYRSYCASLNVNTIADSPTMYSRRLVEIMACGGIAVSSPALSIDRLFPGLVHVVRNSGEAGALFARLRRDGPSSDDLERAREAARHVTSHYSWRRALTWLVDWAR